MCKQPPQQQPGNRKGNKSPGHGGSAAGLLSPPLFNTISITRSPGPLAPPSPSSLHRSPPLTVASVQAAASVTDGSRSGPSAHVTVTASSSHRTQASAGSLPSSFAASSVLSDVLPPPPKAKQRGGSVIKPLTAAQRKVRVSEASRKMHASAASTQHYWQQQPIAIQRQQQHSAQEVTIGSHSTPSPSATQAVSEDQPHSAVDIHASNLLPAGFRAAVRPPPAPAFTPSAIRPGRHACCVVHLCCPLPQSVLRADNGCSRAV